MVDIGYTIARICGIVPFLILMVPALMVWASEYLGNTRTKPGSVRWVLHRQQCFWCLSFVIYSIDTFGMFGIYGDPANGVSASDWIWAFIWLNSILAVFGMTYLFVESKYSLFGAKPPALLKYGLFALLVAQGVYDVAGISYAISINEPWLIAFSYASYFHTFNLIAGLFTMCVMLVPMIRRLTRFPTVNPEAQKFRDKTVYRLKQTLFWCSCAYITAIAANGFINKDPTYFDPDHFDYALLLRPITTVVAISAVMYLLWTPFSVQYKFSQVGNSSTISFRLAYSLAAKDNAFRWVQGAQGALQSLPFLSDLSDRLMMGAIEDALDDEENGGKGGGGKVGGGARADNVGATALDTAMIKKQNLMTINDVTLNKIVGKGATADVYQAIWHGTEVAVKKFKAQNSSTTTYMRSYNYNYASMAHTPTTSASPVDSSPASSPLVTPMGDSSVLLTISSSSSSSSSDSKEQYGTNSNGMPPLSLPDAATLSATTSSASSSAPPPMKRETTTAEAAAIVAEKDHFLAFQNEFAINAQLGHHPRIVSFLGACIDRQNLFLVFTYMPYGSVERLLIREGAFPVDPARTSSLSVLLSNLRVVLQMLVDASSGILHVHSEEIHAVHRDIAARNFLVDSLHRVTVCDFGMSRILPKGEQCGYVENDSLPLKWCAPESIQYGIFSEKSDVYMFGMFIFETIAREEPFMNLTLEEAADGVLRPSNALRPTLPPYTPSELADIMTACWQTDPSARPTTLDLHRALNDLLLRCIDAGDRPDRIEGVIDPIGGPSVLSASGAGIIIENPTQKALSMIGAASAKRTSAIYGAHTGGNAMAELSQSRDDSVHTENSIYCKYARRHIQ